MAKSKRSKRSTRRYRRRRSHKTPKIPMKETHLGGIHVGRDGKAYKVVRLSSGRKGWRLCRYPGIGPEITHAKRGKRLSAAARRRPRCSFKRRQGLTPPEKAQRASYRPDSKASDHRIGHVEQGQDGVSLYKVAKNKQSGRKLWVKCRVSKGPGKRLSAAQRRRPYCMYRGARAAAVEADTVESDDVFPSVVRQEGPSPQYHPWSVPKKIPSLKLAGLSPAKYGTNIKPGAKLPGPPSGGPSGWWPFNKL